MYPQSMFWSKNKKNITTFHLKIVIFIAVKYCSILHGHVCVMQNLQQCILLDTVGNPTSHATILVTGQHSVLRC